MSTKRINSFLLLLVTATAFCVLFAQAAGGESGTKTTDSGTKTADSGTKTTNPSSDAGPSADAGPSSDAGPPLDGSDDDTEPVKDTKPATIPTTSSPSSGTFPGFTLYDGADICFRASLQAQLLITYYTNETSNTRIWTRTLYVPESARVDGKCGLERTTFSLSWADGNYTLSMDFIQKKENNSTSDVATSSSWFSNSISFTFDATNNSDFHMIKIPAVYTAQLAPGNDDVYFKTLSNYSYSCTIQEDATLYVINNGTKDESVIESVDLSMWDVRIQAFQLPQTGIFSESSPCKADVDNKTPGLNIVPLAVAGCLASIIVIIVIAYYFIKNKSTTQYDAME